jgi:hypothetical protein
MRRETMEELLSDRRREGSGCQRRVIKVLGMQLSEACQPLQHGSPLPRAGVAQGPYRVAGSPQRLDSLVGFL